MKRISEDGHTDKPSAIRKLKVSIENAQAILKALESNDKELMSWWMDKVTLANDYLSKAKDYITNPVSENLSPQGYSSLKRSISAINYNMKDLQKAFNKRDDNVLKNEIDNILYDAKRMMAMVKKFWTEDVNEAVYKLKPGSTASDLDELDAAMARSKLLGNPDFSKLTWTFKSKNRRQNIMVDKMMKKLKHKKIKEAATPKNQPNYYKGLSKKDKEERERVIKRRTKMDSDDPKAYKGFATDKGVKTKPSKWTAKFKKMYGEMTEDQKKVVHEKLSAKIRKSLKNKAKKANAPMGALTQVYNKGLAAWRTGHRPGASQHAWAMGRVNSFLAGGPARKVDSAQWNKVKKHRKK